MYDADIHRSTDAVSSTLEPAACPTSPGSVRVQEDVFTDPNQEWGSMEVDMSGRHFQVVRFDDGTWKVRLELPDEDCSPHRPTHVAVHVSDDGTPTDLFIVAAGTEECGVEATSATTMPEVVCQKSQPRGRDVDLVQLIELFESYGMVEVQDDD